MRRPVEQGSLGFMPVGDVEHGAGDDIRVRSTNHCCLRLHPAHLAIGPHDSIRDFTFVAARRGLGQHLRQLKAIVWMYVVEFARHLHARLMPENPRQFVRTGDLAGVEVHLEAAELR